MDETDVDRYFYHNILYNAPVDNRIVRVSKGSIKKIFAFELFQFCNLKNQQRVFLEEEVTVSLKELAAILNTLRQFLKQYDKTVKFPALYTLAKPKQEIRFNLFKDELYPHYFQDIKEHCNRQIRLFFILSVTKSVVSPSKNFKLLVIKTF